MRLYKKAAVCLLAAAMAVSMMSACGGGGSVGDDSSSNSNADSSAVEPEQPDSEQPDSKPEGTGESDGKDDEQEKPSLVPISLDKSKYFQFINKLKIQDEAYEKHTETGYNKKGEKVYEIEVISARKNKNEYSRVTDGSKIETYYSESVNENTTDTYRIYEKEKVAVKNTINNGVQVTGDDGIREMYATKLDLNGKMCYAEVIMDAMNDRHTIYFDESGNPICMVDKCNNVYGYGHDHLATVIITFQNYRFSSADVCQLPENYTVYTTQSTTLGAKLTDTKGNSYFYSDKTLKVTDSDGNDVTDQFGWYAKTRSGSDRITYGHYVFS